MSSVNDTVRVINMFDLSECIEMEMSGSCHVQSRAGLMSAWELTRINQSKCALHAMEACLAARCTEQQVEPFPRRHLGLFSKTTLSAELEEIKQRLHKHGLQSVDELEMSMFLDCAGDPGIQGAGRVNRAAVSVAAELSWTHTSRAEFDRAVQLSRPNFTQAVGGSADSTPQPRKARCKLDELEELLRNAKELLAGSTVVLARNVALAVLQLMIGQLPSHDELIGLMSSTRSELARASCNELFSSAQLNRLTGNTSCGSL
ncbi:hypothetical protein B0H34DRAFT_679787 [Crassisporium funariophilum]|nr:hypothetical protein B0H34DRAFT_679787 [Crassisporium funariophilum]